MWCWGNISRQSRKFIRLECFKYLYKDKAKAAVREKGLVHEGTITSIFLHLGLVTHSTKMPALRYFIQMNWGHAIEINAICSESPEAQLGQGVLLIIFRISLTRVKVTSGPEDICRIWGQRLSASQRQKLWVGGATRLKLHVSSQILVDSWLMSWTATITLTPFCFYGHAACGILVPQPGIESVAPAVEAWSPNHWTAREVPNSDSFKYQFSFVILSNILTKATV